MSSSESQLRIDPYFKSQIGQQKQWAIGIVAYGAQGQQYAQILYSVRAVFWLGAISYSLIVVTSKNRKPLGSRLRLWSLLVSITSFCAAVIHVLYLTGTRSRSDKLASTTLVLLPIVDSLAFSTYFAFALVIASGFTLLKSRLRRNQRQLLTFLATFYALEQMVLNSLILFFQKGRKLLNSQLNNKQSQQSSAPLSTTQSFNPDNPNSTSEIYSLQVAFTINIIYWIVSNLSLVYLVFLIVSTIRYFSLRVEKLKSENCNEFRVFDLERRVKLLKGYVGRVCIYTSLRFTSFILSCIPINDEIVRAYQVLGIVTEVIVMTHIIYTNTAFRPNHNNNLILKDSLWDTDFEDIYIQDTGDVFKKDRSLGNLSTLQSIGTYKSNDFVEEATKDPKDHQKESNEPKQNGGLQSVHIQQNSLDNDNGKAQFKEDSQVFYSIQRSNGSSPSKENIENKNTNGQKSQIVGTRSLKGQAQPFHQNGKQGQGNDAESKQSNLGSKNIQKGLQGISIDKNSSVSDSSHSSDQPRHLKIHSHGSQDSDARSYKNNDEGHGLGRWKASRAEEQFDDRLGSGSITPRTHIPYSPKQDKNKELQNKSDDLSPRQASQLSSLEHPEHDLSQLQQQFYEYNINNDANSNLDSTSNCIAQLGDNSSQEALLGSTPLQNESDANGHGTSDQEWLYNNRYKPAYNGATNNNQQRKIEKNIQRQQKLEQMQKLRNTLKQQSHLAGKAQEPARADVLPQELKQDKTPASVGSVGSDDEQDDFFVIKQQEEKERNILNQQNNVRPRELNGGITSNGYTGQQTELNSNAVYDKSQLKQVQNVKVFPTSFQAHCTLPQHQDAKSQEEQSVGDKLGRQRMSLKAYSINKQMSSKPQKLGAATSSRRVYIDKMQSTGFQISRAISLYNEMDTESMNSNHSGLLTQEEYNSYEEASRNLKKVELEKQARRNFPTKCLVAFVPI